MRRCDTHWSNKFVGKKYIDGIYDCGDTVEDIQNVVFNRGIILPAREGTTMSILTEQLQAEKDNYAKKVDNPFEGDVLLMRGISGRLNHIGVYFRTGNTDYVIHNIRTLGSVVITPIRKLKVFGFIPEGYFRWK